MMKNLCKNLLLLGDAAVILDTETTGLDSRAEVLSVAVLSMDGQTLFNERVRPANVTSWPEAQAVHGISPADVNRLPRLAHHEKRLGEILYGKTVVVYNASYDRRLLVQSAVANRISQLAYELDKLCLWEDVMEPYAQYWGAWSEWHQSFTWQSLVKACDQQGVEVADAHDALGDCRMTLALIKKIASK